MHNVTVLQITVSSPVYMATFILAGVWSVIFSWHVKTAKQRTTIRQYGDWYTLDVDGWAVTFGTPRRGLGEAAARPGPSLLY